MGTVLGTSSSSNSSTNIQSCEKDALKILYFTCVNFTYENYIYVNPVLISHA